MVGLLRRCFLGIAVAVGLALAADARACPFCTQQGQTLTGQVEQATLVLYGTLSNAVLKDPDSLEGTTDLKIETVVKDHKFLDGRKVITLNRYVPPPTEGKWKYLVFCDVFKGKLDPYSGLAVKADSDIAGYLKGALAVKDKKVEERLRFFFDYLDNADTEISNDAYKEFANADYKDYAVMAGKLPAERIAKWLGDKNTQSFRYGLYASMLGHCGVGDKDRYAGLLRSMLDDADKRGGSGVDGILAGYILLKPEEGWKYTRALLKDPKREFMLRYAALRTVRFFWDNRPDLISKAELTDGAALLLDQADIADLAVEDLRKWERWEMADKVLALRGTKAYDVPIVRRSILRYCLQCKKSAAAADYVREQRDKDPEKVAEAEELLDLEKTNR
jgi:hypothetical protein